ncbi:MAG: DegT/DnrJ/EryC1/StrS family aminotransferase [Deltaproteobacteria bacterium]|nr:DegT/DnrJ/EryC1/StrS family aminotransferase [Deltaproteobacteria bacterium]
MQELKFTFGKIRIGDAARKRILESLDAHWVSAGKHVQTFEQKFKNHFNYHEAVAVSSGTAACFAAVAALYDFEKSQADEIIVPALSFVATANAVRAAGFKPVFVDIDRKTLNLDPSKIESAISKKTKAIQVVHTMGKPCDMTSIMNIAEKYHLVVLEDCCEAHGASYQNQIIGSFGLAGTFSFYAAHLICSGEGGMVTTHDPEFAKLLRSVRSHGRPDGTDYFQFDRFGFNCKMNDLEAAIGIEGIDHFDEIFKTRKKNLLQLLDQNRDLAHVFYFLTEEKDEVISPHAFPLVFRQDIAVQSSHLYHFLLEHGIQVKTLFGSLPTQHRAFSYLQHRLGEFPEAEYVGEKGLHFGCHQYLTPEDIAYVSTLLHEYVKKWI